MIIKLKATNNLECHNEPNVMGWQIDTLEEDMPLNTSSAIMNLMLWAGKGSRADNFAWLYFSAYKVFAMTVLHKLSSSPLGVPNFASKADYISALERAATFGHVELFIKVCIR